VPELVGNGDTGWLVPAGDRQALVRAIDTVRTIPRERLAAIGAAGAARVRARHLAVGEIPKLVQLCSDALRQK
jgi:glycosyltransferase involved in cell wall biosynthesis